MTNPLAARIKARIGTATPPSVARLFFDSFLRSFSSKPCSICDRTATGVFCLDCDRQLQRSFQHQTLQHRTRLHQARLHQTPRQAPAPHLLAQPVVALGEYEGILKRAIGAMKYRDRPDVAYPLGAALAHKWQSCAAARSGHHIYALPIPLHAERQKSRGYNQAERIASAFCKISGLPLLPNGLRRVQATQPQHSLGPQERQQNLAQVFQVDSTLQQLATLPKRSSRTQPNGPHPNELCPNELRPNGLRPNSLRPSILLIDDIYTTGATVQSAAQVIKRAGFSVIGTAVIARAVMS